MKKFYIAPEVECIEIEPMQMLAASNNNNKPGAENEYESDLNPGNTVGGDNYIPSDAKEKEGLFGDWD